MAEEQSRGKGRAEKFEDLVVWQMAREITSAVYELTRQIAAKDYGFCDQIRRAAVSVMNNIAEGYERGTTKELSHFLYIARGSAGEVRSMLTVALDQKYITGQKHHDLMNHCKRCSAGIWRLIQSLQRPSSVGGSDSLSPL